MRDARKASGPAALVIEERFDGRQRFEHLAVSLDEEAPVSFADKLKENWAGYLVTGLFGGLLVQAFAMHGKLSEVSTGLAGLVQRVDRIAEVLPDVSVRVAQDELARPVRGAVVVASAARSDSGEWITAVHLVNTDAQTVKTYTMPLKGPDDPLAGIVASGLAVDIDGTAVSFETAAGWSVIADEPSHAPTWVDASKSYLLRSPRRDFETVFEETLTSTFPMANKYSGSVPLTERSWRGVADELSDSSFMHFLEHGAN